jgi:hypothetical protein
VPVRPAYRLETRDQAGAEAILSEAGALAEIAAAVIAHCDAHAPGPPYKPQEIKRHLTPLGWLSEVRVPPYDPRHDRLPINERYDLYKTFECNDRTSIGVAIEIERWEVWNDLLKFRRGLRRGQIAAGLLLHDNVSNLNYVYEHLRWLSEPLFGDLPVLYAAPRGPGLSEEWHASRITYGPYRFPPTATL